MFWTIRIPSTIRRLQPGPSARMGVAILVAVSLLAIAGVGNVTAHDAVIFEPGTSGSCANDSGDGGSFESHVGDHNLSFTDPAEIQSTVAALGYFVDTGGECGGQNNSDYIEVHVTSAAINAQYCYSERSDGDSGDDGYGDEPTDSTTASSGAGEINVGSGDKNSPPSEDGYCEYNRDNTETGPCDPLVPTNFCG